MDATKIRLSQEEEALVLQGHWILTKNGIMQKTMHMLGILQMQQKALLLAPQVNLPAAILQSSPKISRGENYQGLPWLMLDYPRLFNRDDGFAIRTFFWWGHFFSVTLQLWGDYKQRCKPSISSSFNLLKNAGFYVCVNEDPWQHHFGSDNYKPLSMLCQDEWDAVISTGNFIKIAHTVPLQKWNDAPEELVEIFRLLLQAVND